MGKNEVAHCSPCRTIPCRGSTVYLYQDPQGYLNLRRRRGGEDEWTQSVGGECALALALAQPPSPPHPHPAPARSAPPRVLVGLGPPPARPPPSLPLRLRPGALPQPATPEVGLALDPRKSEDDLALATQNDLATAKPPAGGAPTRTTGTRTTPSRGPSAPRPSPNRPGAARPTTPPSGCCDTTASPCRSEPHVTHSTAGTDRATSPRRGRGQGEPTQRCISKTSSVTPPAQKRRQKGPTARRARSARRASACPRAGGTHRPRTDPPHTPQPRTRPHTPQPRTGPPHPPPTRARLAARLASPPHTHPPAHHARALPLPQPNPQPPQIN